MQKPLSIQDFVREVKKGNVGVREHTARILDEAEKSNSSFHYFNKIAKEDALKQAAEKEAAIKTGRHRGRLLGVPVSVKDCLCVKGMESRAGSRILNGYLPLFDATTVEKARAEGAIIIGKTAQDEFGFGTFSDNTGKGFEKPKHPLDVKRACGGSSGGSAGFTALTKNTHASIAESTGGSIACPASFCGVAGFTPTYGRVSRHGLIDYANSLDKIGSMGKTAGDAALLLEVISWHDPRDSTSLAMQAEASAAGSKKGKGLRIGIVKELFQGCEKPVQKKCREALEKMQGMGAELEDVSLPLNAEYGVPSYYIISTSEASTNLARYCGMRYGAHEKLEGSFNEYFSKVRSKHLGEEAKRRILLGTFARMAGFREAYYLRAMKARTLMIKEFRKAFKRFDLLANPAMPITAPSFKEIDSLSPLQEFAMDLCTVPANLAGLPHASLPVEKHNSLPVGLMITANHREDEKMVQGALSIEEACK